MEVEWGILISENPWNRYMGRYLFVLEKLILNILQEHLMQKFTDILITAQERKLFFNVGLDNGERVCYTSKHSSPSVREEGWHV